MLKKTGVWIDTKKAVFVFIEKKNYCFNFIFLNRSQGKNTRRGKMLHTVGNSFLPMQVEVVVVIG
jgi:hypothetical protein